MLIWFLNRTWKNCTHITGWTQNQQQPTKNGNKGNDITWNHCNETQSVFILQQGSVLDGYAAGSDQRGWWRRTLQAYIDSGPQISAIFNCCQSKKRVKLTFSLVSFKTFHFLPLQRNVKDWTIKKLKTGMFWSRFLRPIHTIFRVKKMSSTG